MSAEACNPILSGRDLDSTSAGLRLRTKNRSQRRAVGPQSLRVESAACAALLLLALATEGQCGAVDETPQPQVPAAKGAKGVLEVWRKGHRSNEGTPRVAIGDSLAVVTCNLDGWLIDLINQRRIEGVGTASPDALREFAQLNADGGAKWRDENSKNAEVLKAHEQTRETFEADLKKWQLEKKDAEAQRQKIGVGSGELAPLEQRLRNINETLAPLEAKLADYNKALTRQKALDQSRGVFQALLEDVKRGLYLILDDSELRQTLPTNAAEPNFTTDPATTNTYHLLYYNLEQTAEDIPAWNRLYNGIHPTLTPSVRVGVFIENKQFILPTRVKVDAKDRRLMLQLEVYPMWKLVVVGLIIVGSLIVLLRMIGSTDILRDPDTCLRPDGVHQFSLARCQMAFWFFIVVSSFVLLWIVTRQLDTINDTSLWLIGIGSGTALGAAMISATAASADIKEMNRYILVNKNRTIPELDQSIADNQRAIHNAKVALAAAADEPARTAAQATLDRELEEGRRLDAERAYKSLAAKKAGSVRQLLFDLLNENNKISFHRFQMLVWTAILGFVFVVKVVYDLAMPDFSATILALVGISAGTYVGFKLPAAVR